MCVNNLLLFVKVAFCRIFFFFSSRRRHTRSDRDWSSDVCLPILSFGNLPAPGEGRGLAGKYFDSDGMNKKSKKRLERVDRAIDFDFDEVSPTDDPYVPQERSEERRVGKECRSRWAEDSERKNSKE